MLMKKGGTKNLMIYQVRVQSFKQPTDIVTELTHAVWDVLVLLGCKAAKDPHRWPSLYLTFRDVFKPRMVRYAGCGGHDECRGMIRPIHGERVSLPLPQLMFTLEIPTDIDIFIKRLAAVVLFRTRDVIRPGSAEALSLRARIVVEIKNVLNGYIYFNDKCPDCSVRQGAPDRRMWH